MVLIFCCKVKFLMFFYTCYFLKIFTFIPSPGSVKNLRQDPNDQKRFTIFSHKKGLNARFK